MAEYLIQSETLDAIADAIHAKSGSPTPMTPAEMVTEIAAIPSGGGGRTLLADFTTSEDVSAIQIDFTQSMQGYDLYRVVMTGTISRSPYPYVGLNTATNNAILNSFAAGGSVSANTRWECFIGYVGGVYFLYAQNKEMPVAGGLQYFHTRIYTTDTVFRAGFNVQIWGYTA